jgi:hypothetical protein
VGDFIAPLILATACVAGLALVPFGLPGLWVMVLGVITYGWLTGFQEVGLRTVSLAIGLAGVGELIEWWVGFYFARRYGGSRGAGWAALVGGIAGAVVGVPVAVVGSVLGSFVGAFAGAALFEYARARRAGAAVEVGWGAVLGRAAGVAMKMALGIVIAVVVIVVVLRG